MCRIRGNVCLSYTVKDNLVIFPEGPGKQNKNYFVKVKKSANIACSLNKYDAIKSVSTLPVGF